MVGAEPRALSGQAIDVRSRSERIAIAAEHIACMIVGEDKEEVRFAPRRYRLRRKACKQSATGDVRLDQNVTCRDIWIIREPEAEVN